MGISIDRDDLSQLRRADTIVFRFDTSDDGYSRIEGTIGRFTSDASRSFELGVNPTSVEAYGDKVDRGLWIISTAKFVPEWQTVLALLKAGDELHPHYVADAHHPSDRPNRDPYFTDSLVIDTFDLRVRRTARRTYDGDVPTGPTKLFTFQLGYQITERDGSSLLIRNLASKAVR